MTNIIATDSPHAVLNSLEPAIDPNARPTFLLDWELTMKCNLDCSYCGNDPIIGGHWSKATHPPLDECLHTVDFMFEYVDLYMQHKPKWTRAVVLNIYGGESLLHPDILDILKAVKEKYSIYQNSWPLKITCTTNATIGIRTFEKVSEYINEFTFSYHCESLPKHKETFKKNVLFLKEKNKDLKCIILMHGNQDHWPELLEVIKFCKKHNVNYLPRHIDGSVNSTYNAEQIKWFKDLYIQNSPKKSQETQKKNIIASDKFNTNEVSLTSVGRACCGGRSLCSNKNLKQPLFYTIGNNFKDWYCSVNWMFLYVKQHNGNIYTNKDCQMNFEGNVAPIGTLSKYQLLLDWTKSKLGNKKMPVIQCKKDNCKCGLCAPKALTRLDFDDIIKKHIIQDVFEK